jgi:hypothetical protein
MVLAAASRQTVTLHEVDTGVVEQIAVKKVSFEYDAGHGKVLSRP